MTEEEKKDLLLKDLCGRLPYGVKIQYDIYGIHDLTIDKLNAYIKGDKNIKPYLRPMSSMTEEEILEFYKIAYDTWYSDSLYYKNEEWITFRASIKNNNLCFMNCIWLSDINKVTDYLNKKMFDYRGLIPAGAAIEITEDNNPYRNNKSYKDKRIMDAYYFKDKDGFFYDIVCINDNTNTITGVADSGVRIDFNLSDVILFDKNGSKITKENNPYKD